MINPINNYTQLKMDSCVKKQQYEVSLLTEHTYKNAMLDKYVSKLDKTNDIIIDSQKIISEVLRKFHNGESNTDEIAQVFRYIYNSVLEVNRAAGFSEEKLEKFNSDALLILAHHFRCNNLMESREVNFSEGEHISGISRWEWADGQPVLFHFNAKYYFQEREVFQLLTKIVQEVSTEMGFDNPLKSLGEDEGFFKYNFMDSLLHPQIIFPNNFIPPENFVITIVSNTITISGKTINLDDLGMSDLKDRDEMCELLSSINIDLKHLFFLRFIQNWWIWLDPTENTKYVLDDIIQSDEQAAIVDLYSRFECFS